MSLIIIAPPELEARLRAGAEQQGTDTHSYALSLLEKASAPPSAPSASPRPNKLMPEEETARAADLQKLLAFAGCVDSGDPRSADNDRIDADLAAEYGRGLSDRKK